MQKRITYKISHRDVKYPRLEFKTGELVCVLPFGESPDILLEKHKDWIDKKSKFIEECLKAAENKELILRENNQFKELIYSYVDQVCNELAVQLNNIYFRRMKTKWASLSPQRNLTVNVLMKHLPVYLIEYIIFHEIVHTLEKRHNEHFWKIVAGRFSDYQDRERDLFIYWFLIAKRPSLLSSGD